MCKTRTRIGSILLAAVLLLTLLPVTALAASHENCADGENCTAHEAAIGSTHYDTIGEAIDAANQTSGSDTITVKLMKDATLTGGVLDSVGRYYTVKRILKNITLDLGTHTLTYNENGGFAVNPNCHFTIQNGTYINASNDAFAQGIEGTKYDYDGPGCTITIAKDAVIQAPYGINADGHTTINVYGKIISDVDGIFGAGPKNNVMLDGATIEAGVYGVYQQKKDGGSTYTIKNSSITTPATGDTCAVFISNNKASAEDTVKQGMQTLVIENSVISGQDGIEVMYTDVTISGEGTEVTAAADGHALGVTYYEGEGEAAVGTLNISGGTFNGVIGFMEGEANTATLTITGGKFLNSDGTVNNDVKDYVQDGMKQDENGQIIVDPETAEAKIGDVDYITLTKALEAAVAGDTVVLLKNANLTDTIDSGVTLSVGEDITLTIDAADLTKLITSEGKIRVNAGGVLDVGGTEMVGGSDANINLTGGCIDVSIDGTALKLEFAGATAQIPEGHRWTLLLASTYPMNVTLDKDTTLTVNSTGANGEDDGFRVANGAALTNNGKILVNGVMSISSEGKVNGDGAIRVASGGVLEVNTSKETGSVGELGNSVFVNGTFVWNGTTYDLSDGIILSSGGKVYSQADIGSAITGYKREMYVKTYNGIEYAYAWKYYVPSSPSIPSTGAGSYAVTVSGSSNGTVTVSPTVAAEGATVTITVKADDGYVLDTLTVRDNYGNTVAVTEYNGNYTFTMPGSSVTVYAAFRAKSGSLPFVDVNTGDWFYEAVKYVYDNGMMSGVETYLFAPNSNLTRGMICQVLYNLEGRPHAGTGAFTDVAAGKWYADAVNWAAANGIVDGYGSGKFGPEDDITREQMAAILYRYAQYKGYDVSVGENTNILSYLDVADVSEYAIPAFQWACGSGVINGMTESTLGPKGTATRAQVASMLMRFCEYVAK